MKHDATLVYPLVLVDWVDSCENRDNSDQFLDDLPQPQRILQCGFLVQEDESYIVVASAVKIELGTVDYAIAIPRCSISYIRNLGIEGSTDGTD
jgi:hypothetical protein